MQIVPKAAPKGHFNKGNYFHELAHEYYKLIKAGVDPGSDHAVALITAKIERDVTHYLQGNPGDGSLITTFAVIAKMFQRYIKEQSPRIDAGITVESVEAEVAYPVSSDVILSGFTDLLYWDNGGNPRVRDHKSGERSWSKLDAINSAQLLFYVTVVFMLTGEIPFGEISYINTKEYVKKIPSHAESYTFSVVGYNKKELKQYFEHLCMLVESMLGSKSIPNYSQACTYCPYQGPCYAERKGIDSTPIILQHFTTKEPVRKHASFTDEYASGDAPNKKLHS